MKTIFSCFFCLFCLFTIGCTHQSSQENCVEIGSADSICLQKELYTLHDNNRYRDVLCAQKNLLRTLGVRNRLQRGRFTPCRDPR